MKNKLTENAMPANFALELVSFAKPTYKRFRSCNAYVSEPMKLGGSYFTLIRSYETVVGIADSYNNTITEFGKYSVTTSKQFTQIYNSLFPNFSREYNPCHLN